MNSRVPPNSNEQADNGQERPLGQWLDNRIGMSRHAAAQSPAAPAAAPRGIPAQTAESVEEIHRRLDGITRQIDQMSQRRAGQAQPAAANGLANQLNDAISRLDMRLSNMAQTPPQRPVEPRYPAPERPAAPAYREPAYRDSPPIAPNGMDAAIAEISARRNDLSDGSRQSSALAPQYFARPAVHAPQPHAAQPRHPASHNPAHQNAPQPAYVAAPPAAPVDLSGIERQLNHLTTRMDAIRTPDHLDQSIAAFRQELAEIRHSLTEALPRRAIESLESDIRGLAQKIENSRNSAADAGALASIEQALNDIYDAVRALKPAEQLEGYDTAIQNLSAKIDMLVRANPGPNMVQQLEDAITALRGIASNVASNDAVNRLSDHLQALGEKVEHLAQSDSSGMLSALEQRIALLTRAMETRSEAPVQDSSNLEHAILALSERIDRLSAPTDNSAAMAQVEQRIAYLLERIEAAQPAYPAGFARIEDSLMDVLRQLDQQRVHFAAMDRAMPTQDSMQSDYADAIRRELSDVRYSQVETDRRMQDSLEAVQNTLSHVVDRLSMIEGDLRRVQAPPPPPAPPEPPRSFRPATDLPVMTPHAPSIRPELPNPARAQSVAAYPPVMQRPAAPDMDEELFAAPATAPRALQREPIDSSLPPDFPLEPGARTRADAFTAQPDGSSGQDDAADGGSTNFIAAARRAAKASMDTPESAKPGRISALTQAARNAAAKATAKTKSEPVEKAAASSAGSKVRSVLVGVSVVVIVLGTFKMALALIDSDPVAQTESSAKPTSALTLPSPKAEAPAPLLTSPTAVQQQSFVAPVPHIPATETAPLVKSVNADVTGTILMPSSATASATPAPAASPSASASLVPVTDAIPDALAGPSLRAAAQRGEPAAAYEVAVRYAEGKGVTANYDEAAKWYERSARGGVVPAMFRLGSILEKGLGGKKDPETARHYYMSAAERGHAKAMHNLAVLDADGGGKGPNYKSATGWFKKAAERGVADSQYNLAILYARGIGVEQNLAESYKWFSLAAAQGDADAGQKRDDVAKRLDQQSLAAAKLAVQTFSPEKQPDDVLNVATPTGGWDSSPAAAATTAKKPAKSAAKQSNPVR